MSDIKIIENCLSKENFNFIKETIYSEYFAWYFNIGVNNKNDDNTQFTHTFYNHHKITSNLFDNLASIIQVLNPLSLIRIKSNLLLKTEKIREHGLHTDQQYKSTTAIFYLNTNNGYTKFENGEKVESVANRMVTFPANLKHTGTSCTDEKTRVVINFNYFK